MTTITQPDGHSSRSVGPLAVSVFVLIVTALLLITANIAVYFPTREYTDSANFIPIYRTPTFSESLVVYKMDYIRNSDEYNDVVYVGASAGLSGIIPDRVDASTGIKSFNLGTVSWLGPDGHTDMIRTYLANHPVPQVVVYTAFPAHLSESVSNNQEFRERFIRVYGTETQITSPVASITAQTYLREGIRTLIGLRRGAPETFFDQSRQHRPSHSEMEQELLDNRGFMEDTRNGEIELQDGVAFGISDWYAENIEELAQLITENGATFVLRLMPIPGDGGEIDDSELAQWAVEFEKTNTDVVIDRPLIQQYPANHFAKSTHLNLTGAEVFTDTLAEDLARSIK
jgi:hypothetical protein